MFLLREKAEMGMMPSFFDRVHLPPRLARRSREVARARGNANAKDGNQESTDAQSSSSRSPGGVVPPRIGHAGPCRPGDLLDGGGLRLLRHEHPQPGRRRDPVQSHRLTTVDVPPATNAIFGSFTTLAAPPSPGVTLVDTFTLTITQTAPAPGGTVVFTSTVGGTIFLNNSQAFVQFNAPLIAVHRQRRIHDDLPDRRRGRQRTRAGWSSSAGWDQVSTLNGEISIAERSPRSPSRGRWPWPASPCRCWAWGTCVAAVGRPRRDDSLTTD